jgi:hypothetical protein
MLSKAIAPNGVVPGMQQVQFVSHSKKIKKNKKDQKCKI